MKSWTEVEMFLDVGKITILVIKWTRTWLNYVLVLNGRWNVRTIKLNSRGNFLAKF